MSRIKNLWWTALILAVCLLKPAIGLCMERDPYRYRSLVGSIYFEFEKGSARFQNWKNDTKRLTKIYALELRSWILSRRLMVYNVAFEMMDTDYSASSGSRGSGKRMSYRLNTTLLPKSLIPLTLRARKTEYSSSSSESSTSTSYGLTWFGRFKVLPVTSINAEKQHAAGGGGGDTSSTTYTLDMKKKLGSSENEFAYGSLLNRNKSSGSENNASNIRFTNKTALSRTSEFYIGFIRTDSDSSDGPGSAFTGTSAYFTSQPNPDFSQSHSYTSYSSDASDSTQTGTVYSGRLNYRISSRLATAMSMSLNNSEAVTPSIKTRSEDFSTADSIRYAVTPNLTLSEELNYGEYKSTSSDPATPNLTDRTHLTLITNANYAKRLGWTNLSSYYGVGYTEDKTDKGPGGKGLVQNIGLNLPNINFNRYAGFNARAADSETINLVGNLSEKKTTYHLDAFSKTWKRYAVMTADYSRTNQSSWIEGNNYYTESYGARATSNYIKNTSISAFYTRAITVNQISGATVTTMSGLNVKSFGVDKRKYYGFTFDAGINFGGSVQSATGTSSSNSEYASVGYSRRLLGGDLSAKWRVDVRNTTRNEDKTTTVNNLYTAAYSRRFSKKISWNANVTRTTSTTDFTAATLTTARTTVTNSIVWPVRAWFFSAEHRYVSSTVDTSPELVETTLLLKAARTFTRIF